MEDRVVGHAARSAIAVATAIIAATAAMVAATPVFATTPVFVAQDSAPATRTASSPQVEGRVVDLATGDPIEGAAIALTAPGEAEPDARKVESVSNDAGLFTLANVPPGDYAITVSHIAYGTHAERLTLAANDRIALRIALSPTAIELDPITVEALSDDTRAARASGSPLRRLTAAQLAPIVRSGDHLANALARLVPGIRARSGRSQPGQLVCVEFRDPASLAAPGCRTPVVIVDNVRQANALITLNTLPIGDIRSVETLGPGQAGVRFGADASYGVVVIETLSGSPRDGPVLGGGTAGSPGGTYSWALESRPYPWKRAFAAAAAANAAGLLAGYALSRSCLSFDDLSRHVAGARCGSARNAASRLVLYGGPQVAVGFVSRRVGATDLSRGSAWKNAVAGTMMAVPGIMLALTTEDDGFQGSSEVGIAMAVVAAPLTAVLADRLFRRVRH